MGRDHLGIPINSNDASWKQRCSDKMRELKNRQRADAASKPGIMHKELVLHISELHKAVEDGNVDNFVDVLGLVCERRKLPLRYIFDESVTGDSLLHVAANLGREEIAELICDEFPGLLVGRNIRGDTALHIAVRSKNSTMINLILSQFDKQKGKQVIFWKHITSEKNENEDTPLHEAVKSKEFDVVKVILDATDKNVVHCLNKSKRSPLFLAVVSGNMEILNLLLEIPFRADLPLPQCFGNSPLHAAILQRNPDLIEEIQLKKPELVYLKDEDGNSPLHYAVYIGYIKGCCLLLKASSEKLNNPTLEWNKKGCRLIHLACKRGHVGMVEVFLKHEWPINSPVNQKGQNILHVAAKNGRSNLVKYLLRHQNMDAFTLNQKDNDGNTPLHLASKNLFRESLLFISRDKRADINLLNNNSLTARDTVLVSNSERSFRKDVANEVLNRCGVPITVNRLTLHSEHGETNNLMRRKDTINTYLVVGTLMVTVTFAAAFTVLGGIYNSDEPNPKNRGLAVLADNPNFKAFIVLNTMGMFYSVTTVAFLLLAVTAGYEGLAEDATFFAGWSLYLAFLAVQLAFMTATRLVLGKTTSLSTFILVIGVFHSLGCTCYALMSLSRHVRLFVRVGGLLLFGWAGNYDSKPKGSSSQKANKNKDLKLEAHAS